MGVLVSEQAVAGERLSAARRVLASAEATAGLRTTLPHPAGAGALRPVGVGTTDPSRPSGADPVLGDRVLPVPDALLPVLPDPGLRRGGAVRVEGSTSLLLGLAAAACRDGAWCAVVGMPDLGLAAAAEHGLPMDRTVLVPAPGADTPAVLGALVDGVDVVVLGDVPHLVERDRRRLASRLRHRAALLLTPGAWPGVQVTLTVVGSRWVGVEEGNGSFRARELTVRVAGRGAAGRAGQVSLHSPDGVRLVLAEVVGAGADVVRRAG